jgi:hypothetical protein
MKTILKNIKTELTNNLSNEFIIGIFPPNIIGTIPMAIDKLPLVAISPLSITSPGGQIAGTVGRVNRLFRVQIAVLDKWTGMEKSIVGETGQKGIIEYVNDVISVLEWNTLSDYLVKGNLQFTDISFETILPSTENVEQYHMASLTVEVTKFFTAGGT